MNQSKVLSDTILATKDTIFILQQWQDLLVRWQTVGQIEEEAFAEACRTLKDMGLWNWAREAGGHGIEILIRMGASDLDITQLTYGNTAAGQLTDQCCIGRDQR